jgi:endonuclease YncB( thermonuclease family)
MTNTANCGILLRMAWGRGTDNGERRGWHGMNQPRPRLPDYLRPSKRLRSLDEFEPPAWKGRVRFGDEDRVTVRGVARDTLRWLAVLRPFIFLAILASAYVGLGDPALVEPPGFLSGEPEPVSETFTRCGPGRGHACVIDGDTFKLGTRKVRIIGIDTPETHPARCPEEARLGEEATAMLQGLLNQGPFEMVAPIYRNHDRYGRDLRAIRRRLPGGDYQSIASDMREAGLAHRYLGGFKIGWC